MITYRIAPVAIVFPNSATASLPADKLSPMIPEPITVATKKKVPKNSIEELTQSFMKKKKESF